MIAFTSWTRRLSLESSTVRVSHQFGEGVYSRENYWTLRMLSYPCPETAGEYSTAARGIKPQWGFWLTESIQQNVESNVANVGNFNADNGPNVNDWNRDNGNSNVFAVPLVVSGKCDSNLASFAWRNESIRQASCQLPVKKLGAQCNFYLLAPGYLWQTLREFLKDLVLC